jgi:hypothetical protein
MNPWVSSGGSRQRRVDGRFTKADGKRLHF